MKVRIRTIYAPEDIKPLFVIVEMWDKKNFGRGKRGYYQEFTEHEQRVIASYYDLLYRWYLRTGIPYNGVDISYENYDLLTRAANYFGSL